MVTSYAIVSVLGYCNNGVTSLLSVQVFSVDNGTSWGPETSAQIQCFQRILAVLFAINTYISINYYMWMWSV